MNAMCCNRMSWRMALCLSLGAVMLVSISATFAGAQSIAEVARETRKEKKAHAKVVTNDTLPPQETISVVGPQASATDSEDANSEDKTSDNKTKDRAADADEGKDAKPADKKTDEDKTAAAKFQEEMDGWKKRVAAQQDSISLLERELDVVQREYRLRAAAFYADAGNRLRSQGEWDKMDRDYKDKIDTKQKQLDAAKQKLSDIKDEARKAGMPNSVSE